MGSLSLAQNIGVLKSQFISLPNDAVPIRFDWGKVVIKSRAEI